MTADSIVVSSHVGRDILQSAQMFRTVESAVWEVRCQLPGVRGTPA